MKKREFKTTTNRKVYNRLRKEKLACCSRCRWHSSFYHYSENDNQKSYWVGKRNPNWKLVSKNKKQWMKKPLHYIEQEGTHKFFPTVTHIVW